MKAIDALISPLILLTAASTVGKGKLKIDPENRYRWSVMKRLIYVTVVMSCALGLAGGSGYARARRPGPTPRRPSMSCAFKTIGVAHVMYNKKQKLSFYYPPTRLVAAMRPKRDYEVFTQPDGEVRISRTFDGVKYNIRFAGGSNLSFIMADGHPLSFNVDTDIEKNYPYGRAVGGEKCGTPDDLIESNVSRMIEDLPLDARQKAELRGYVVVLTFGQPSDLQGLKKVYVETGADSESRERIIRELNKPELGLTLLDGPDGAEIILDFGSRTEDHFDKNTYPDTSASEGVRLKQILLGRGRVFVVRDGKPQSVMSFENTKSTFWERDPATNFGRAFHKLYKKVNGIK
ncbi:MAG: hypothetical protein ABW250_06900 [Pyrinomonadaceae bacterium]